LDSKARNLVRSLEGVNIPAQYQYIYGTLIVTVKSVHGFWWSSHLTSSGATVNAWRFTSMSRVATLDGV